MVRPEAHKALPSSALLEKHPVRRVGGAEGARDAGTSRRLAPIAAQKSECAIGTCYNWTIGPRFRLVRTFDLAPPSGRVALGGRFPGLKPWAKSWWGLRYG